MADKDDKQDALTPVGPGSEETESRDEDAPHDAAAGEEYAYGEGEETDAEERVGHAEEEGSGEELSREQRRRRRKREKYDRDQRELAFLRSRNEQLEREQSRKFFELENRQTQSDLLAVDGRISQAESDVREAEDLLRQALEKGDAGAATEALRVRDELRDGVRQLQGAKAQALRAAQSRQAAPTAASAPDPVVSQRAHEWVREHDWFDPQLRDEDSFIAKAIEDRMFAEGRLDPRSDAYWVELDRRLAKRLPERYRDMDDEDDRDREVDDRAKRRTNGNGVKRASGGPTFRTGGRERTLRQGEVYIDAERRAALEEKGVWDDPVLRQKYLESYQKYDREHGRRRH